MLESTWSFFKDNTNGLGNLGDDLFLDLLKTQYESGSKRLPKRGHERSLEKI